jgi:hypothetical protein
MYANIYIHGSSNYVVIVILKVYLKDRILCYTITSRISRHYHRFDIPSNNENIFYRGLSHNFHCFREFAKLRTIKLQSNIDRSNVLHNEMILSIPQQRAGNHLVYLKDKPHGHSHCSARWCAPP